MMLAIIIIVITGFIVLDLLRRRRDYDLTANIPGPPLIPIIGTAYIFKRRRVEDSLKFVEEQSEKYGPIIRAWIFQRLVIMIRKPEILEFILSSPKYITKNYLYNFLTDWLGSGLLLSTGLKWHARRKIITPAFHFKILEDFVEVFDQHSTILVQKMESHVDKTEFNIHPYVTLAALDVVCETAMGTKVNAQTDPNCEYVKAVAEITTIVIKRFVNVWFRIGPIFKTFAPKMKKREDNAIKVLHNFTERVIADRRKSLLLEEQNKDNINFNTSSSENDIGTKKKLALLDVLLQSTIDGKSLSNEDIREEVDTFMFEGHDTTTSAICFTLYCISRHTDAQSKAFQEICDIVGTNKNQPVTYRNLQDMKYLECIIKESLRLFPSVPVIGRMLTEDAKIGKYYLPAGANITIPIFMLLKDSKIFPDPEVFRPERHLLDDSAEKMNPYAYLPFSAGPRNCIGQKFAILEMKSVISKILRHYELLPLGPKPIPVLNLVLRSLNGIHIGIKQRLIK